MKAFYSDFVTHCLRFYCRHRDPKFRSDADKKNWYACDNALKGFEDSDKAMLIQIYADGDTIADNVYQTAKKLGIDQDGIWKMLHDLERKVAKKRGLI